MRLVTKNARKVLLPKVSTGMVGLWGVMLVFVGIVSPNTWSGCLGGAFGSKVRADAEAEKMFPALETDVDAAYMAVIPLGAMPFIDARAEIYEQGEPVEGRGGANDE